MTAGTRISLYQPSIGEKELSAVAECIRSGMISSLGPSVREFERDFARFCDVPYATAVSSGTAALHLILKTLGVGPGDEVIVPSFTFVATANAVVYTGAAPRFVDVSPEDWALDVDQVVSSLTSRVKAVIVVHPYGAVSLRYRELSGELARRGIHLVEDAAEALGSNVEGKPVGGASVFGAFSLYGNKLITAGEGGMVTSSDAERTERLRFLRDQAMDPKNRYYHPEVGFNYRMTAMQAAFGRVQLERANEFLERKRRLFQGYDERLAGLPLRRNPHLAGQSNPPWLYSVLFDSADLRVRCETALARQEIETRPLFFPLADLPMYRGSAVPCGVARDLRERGLSLPSHPDLTEEQIRRVASVIRSTV